MKKGMVNINFMIIIKDLKLKLKREWKAISSVKADNIHQTVYILRGGLLNVVLGLGCLYLVIHLGLFCDWLYNYSAAELLDEIERIWEGIRDNAPIGCQEIIEERLNKIRGTIDLSKTDQDMMLRCIYSNICVLRESLYSFDPEQIELAKLKVIASMDVYIHQNPKATGI